ncbi:unnamed protein product [Rotaria sordida]|uniref:STIL N-terminal domain-containing protein n=1 Tax=Rotaria sordida TaxID=392033 RepID=A0A818R6V0_9BILA|nr:unnamed protein product [Rotaria sordida]
MIPQTTSTEICSSFWDSTPIGRSFFLRFCQYEQLSPQLILEDKVFRSAIRLQNNSTYHSQIKFIGTLVTDDESQRLTYVIDRLILKDSITNEFHNHQPLTGEFLIPIQCANKNSTTINNCIQDGIKEIDDYCHSSLPIELHRYSYLCGQMSSMNLTSLNIDLSFDLITIKNSFTLTPINSDYIHILPTALFKKLSSSKENTIHMNQSQFGYCSLDRTTKNKILFILENDPQACSLPLVGIWVSNITNIQCAFVWAACIRYCMNSSLKQRLRSGINSQQSFLLACYLSTSYNQWNFYEVCLITTNSLSSMTIDYDLWTCSKNIIIPNSILDQYDENSSTQIPYDFEFKRIYEEPKNSPILENISFPIQSINNIQFPPDISYISTKIPHDDNNNHHHQTTLSSTNTNGSLFGVPRLPPRQSINQSPLWDLLSTTTITTPKQNIRSLNESSRSKQCSSLTSSTTISNDIQWKEELIKRMQSYDNHIQSLTALVAQLLANQQLQQEKQNHLPLTPIKESTKRDVAVQSEPLSSNIKHCQQQTSFITATNTTPFTHVQSSLSSSSVIHQHEPMIDYSSLRKSTASIQSESPPPPSVSTDLNPVDILKPIFQFIDKQQQKSTSSLMTTYNSTDTTLLKLNDNETEHQTGNMFNLANVIQQQQQHVTSTRTTGISLISNGVQMQFINQQSSTTTVYPQSVPTSPPPIERLPTSPQKSENNLSIEVHSLEMKYLEDDQLAVAIECDRQSQKTLDVLPQTSQIVDKSLSFETQEYLRRYGLFTDSND